MPTFADSDEEEEEESWHEWQEDNTGEDDAMAVCLFCNHGAETLEELNAHMLENHKFNLLGHVRELQLDTYGRMKFVNFVRKRVRFCIKIKENKYKIFRNSTLEPIQRRKQNSPKYRRGMNGTKKNI